MKKIFNYSLLAILLSFATVNSHAQTDKEYMDLIKSATKLELKSYIYDALELSGTQMEAFDPIFDSYLKKSAKITLGKINNFSQYFDLTTDSSPETVNSLNLEAFNSDKSRIKLDKQFYKKMKKAIGVQKASQFFFLKRYIDNAVEFNKLSALVQ